MTAHLNKFQTIALKTYAEGEFAYLIDVSPGDYETELAKCGDTLLRFLLIELSDKESCETRRDAILRLASAAENIDEVVAALANLPSGTAIQQDPENPTTSGSPHPRPR